MPINVDLSETQNPATIGEFQRVAVGPCHLMVIDVKENGGKKGEHVVKCEVLMHADQTQVGMTHTEQFPAEANMAWKLLKFCYAVKIADREAMKRAKDTGSNYAPIELMDAVGRQFFATISASEKTKEGKTSVFHNLDEMLSVDDEKARNFPRNVGMLRQPQQSTAQQSAAQPIQGQLVGAGAAQSDPFATLT